MLVPKDAYGRILDPGDIVLHTRKGHGKPRRMLVREIVVKRYEGYGGIINERRVHCMPCDEKPGIRYPSVIRNPANLVIIRKRDDE